MRDQARELDGRPCLVLRSELVLRSGLGGGRGARRSYYTVFVIRCLEIRGGLTGESREYCNCKNMCISCRFK